MLKRMCLLLCVAAMCAWSANAKKAAPKEVDEFDESGFTEVGEASAATDDDDEEENEAIPAGLSKEAREEMVSRKKFEEEQRQDEYANSLRRRDWLKDRLMLQIGMGSRYPFMGETGMGMGFGAGVEFITRWHIALYASYGFLPEGDDNVFDATGIKLEGGTGYKVGINYYLFPKNPLHLGISASYGTVYYDHKVEPGKGNVRPIVTVDGWQFDALITYLTNEWYYLQFSFGMYYSPELGKKTPNDNPSLRYQSEGSSKIISAVEDKDGMSKTGLVFGVSIGYALPELFPDDTEKRRRQREKERARSGRD